MPLDRSGQKPRARDDRSRSSIWACWRALAASKRPAWNNEWRSWTTWGSNAFS